MKLTVYIDNHNHKITTPIRPLQSESVTPEWMQSIDDKRPLTLLKHRLKIMLLFAKPKSFKSDNEAVFISKLFEFGLKKPNIKHQKSNITCLRQNGRVERFSGTFKQFINQLSIHSLKQLTTALPEFQFYYNVVRPNQYLDG
jgi:putative transposase